MKSGYWLFIVAFLQGCASLTKDAGFDPASDARVVLQRMTAPDKVASKDLRKQDPRASLWLGIDPRSVKELQAIPIQLRDPPEAFEQERIDGSRTYRQYVLLKETVGEGGVRQIVLACRPGKPDCSTFGDLQTVKVPLERRVWRAAVYGPDGRIERLLDAVYRPKLHRFVVIATPDVRLVGKELRVLGAYGDFAITLDGTFVPLNDRNVAFISAEAARQNPSQVGFSQVVSIRRSDAAGKFFLDVLAEEFAFPAPFHQGAAHISLYLGAMTLTPEEASMDCWVGHGGGSFVISLFPLQAVVGFVGSLAMSLPEVFADDCGRKTTNLQEREGDNEKSQ